MSTFSSSVDVHTAPRPRIARAALVFLFLTVLLTWPQAVRLMEVPDHHDTRLSMWRLAWVAHQLPRDPARLFDANIFWPEPNTLAYSDATLLQGIAAAPLLWLGVPTPLVYNLLVLGSFVLAGAATYLLAYRLTGSEPGALLAGIVFAFTAYRWDHFMHLELLWAGWMPLLLLALHRAFASGHGRLGLTVGALFVAQTWSSIYYGVLLATVLLFMTPILASAYRWADVRRAVPGLAAGALLATALLLPYLLPYRAASRVVGERVIGEMRLYSAGPRHYLASTPESIVYGRTASLGRREKFLFPGLIAAGLAMVAIWPRLDRVRVAYLAGLLVALDLSAGAAGLLFPLLRESVLPFRGLRSPARAGEIVMLMTAVLAAFGWARLSRRLASARARRILAAVAMSAAVLEYAEWPRHLRPVPAAPAPVDAWLAAQPRSALVELPLPVEQDLPRHDPEFEYRSTFHWQPVVNGYSGNTPTSYMRTLSVMREFPSDVAVAHLRSIGVRLIVLHEAPWGTAPYAAAVEALSKRPDVASRATFGEPGSEVRVFEIGAERP